jgi:hypothetical protein
MSKLRQQMNRAMNLKDFSHLDPNTDGSFSPALPGAGRRDRRQWEGMETQRRGIPLSGQGPLEGFPGKIHIVSGRCLSPLSDIHLCDGRP